MVYRIILKVQRRPSLYLIPHLQIFSECEVHLINSGYSFSVIQSMEAGVLQAYSRIHSNPYIHITLSNILLLMTRWCLQLMRDIAEYHSTPKNASFFKTVVEKINEQKSVRVTFEFWLKHFPPVILHQVPISQSYFVCYLVRPLIKLQDKCCNSH